MEADTIQHGRSSKSQKSRGNKHYCSNMNWDNVEKTRQNILSGKTCATCRHRDNPYGACPYEPDARHQRPPCCHKYA